MTGKSVFGGEHVKAAALAGTWYSASTQELKVFLASCLERAGTPAVREGIGVIVSPHAGYAFSAPVAAYGFKAAQAQKVSTVIILAPTHHFAFEGASIWAEGAFETPLGNIQVDQELAAKIMSFDKRFVFRKDVFEGAAGRPENSVETQLPFIRQVFPSARIVPIIVGYPPKADVLRSMAEALVQGVGGRDDVLVVVSVDQSHFHPDKDARSIDARGLQAIEKMDVEALARGHQDGTMEVDGFHVVMTGMMYAMKRGYDQAKLLQYATSADSTGDKASVVGYASMVFYRQTAGSLGGAQQAALLEIARKTLESFVRTGKTPDISVDDPLLKNKEGAFVTLHKQGALRGCIGSIIGDRPLHQTVRDMAVAAASEDPRFRPVTPDELKDIDIEISVLSVPRVIKSADEIVLGKHGVIVSRGFRNRGLFLPQVAVETGWSKEMFLSELCSQKAGLPPDAWKDPNTRLEIFSAEVFGEKK